MWQMCPKCDNQSHGDCRKVESITEDKGIADFSCSLDFRSSFQLSTVSTMSEGSLHNLVYKRRNSRGNSAAILSEQVPDITRRSGDCFSVISSDAPLVATEDQNLGPQFEHKIQVIQPPVLSPLLCNSMPHISNSEFVSGYSVGEAVVDEAPKSSVQRILEVDSAYDSCSSSKSNIEHVLSSMKTEMDETGECSSSSATVKEDMQEDLSEKDFCISILRSHGLIGGVWESRTCASAENIETGNGDLCFRSCKICGRSEATTNLLICDHCEESFHMSCCNPRIKKIPTDEWFCHSCLKKRYKNLKKTVKGKAPHIASVMSGAKNLSSKGESNAITLMLRDTEPYTTGVRIGKGFQAEVPDWSGPINSNVDYIGEPLEMDPMESISLHNSNSPSKHSPISNWLQCREVLDGIGDGVNGTICGKWRRAPLFETQTDKWECFCSILWDPSHADCAVPQELETDQVLKQLKYIEMLRPRLTASRKK
ncbi:uncharacterized protein LOC107428388 isoform X2 [Ziziphus jujuba]|uniref:Uncharacterized protein LOC107428388 isoform X2 n=1 Tax=Ziziphus jujuba TaxID=326968 RepID=A0ABM3IVC5_ZIZJJ|nr:uncharacterized protein LOC107428388 isoform X2 [Ziziphus jujuba]